MNIHEYQAKAAAAPLPRARRPAARWSTRDARRRGWPRNWAASRWVVKAQIHAGGRGKAGGVKVGTSPSRRSPRSPIRCWAPRWSPTQTGAKGQIVSRVLVERAARIEREFYLSLVVDRDSQRIVVIASARAASTSRRWPRPPRRRSTREYVDPGVGLLDFQCRKVATAIGLGTRTTSFTRLLKRMYRLFRDKDCLLLEINPFIETEDGDLVALDCKMSFDDNALFRQGDGGGAARLRRGGPQGGRGHRPRAQLHRARRLAWGAS